jgi:hypothetical protein
VSAKAKPGVVPGASLRIARNLVVVQSPTAGRFSKWAVRSVITTGDRPASSACKTSSNIKPLRASSATIALKTSWMEGEEAFNVAWSWKLVSLIRTT